MLTKVVNTDRGLVEYNEAGTGDPVLYFLLRSGSLASGRGNQRFGLAANDLQHQPVPYHEDGAAESGSRSTVDWNFA